jgi:site-specific DNA-methyltransferase (adenine-specific)
LTIAQNVLKWGTGALNIDASRIGTGGGTAKGTFPNEASTGIYGNGLNGACEIVDIGKGRWPSNLILANVPSVIGLFPETGAAGKASGPTRGKMGTQGIFGGANGNMGESAFYGDKGSASRYFFRADLLPIEQEEMNLPIHVKAIYCSKPSKYERQLGKISETSHPTVKPVALMHHLVTLITPPNGVCVDPYCGSGTTGIAAMLGGFRFVGLEMTSEYIPIATNRIKNWKHYRQFVEAKKDDTPSKKARETTKAIQQSLF